VIDAGDRETQGENVADELILAGQRVLPERLLAAGFAFRCPVLSGAFGEVFST
jgi:NAD dependent epimerase/dehydratase family enzyme